MYYENVDQIVIVIDDIFLRDNGSKIFEIKCLMLLAEQLYKLPFEMDISISPISVEEICDLVTFFLVLLNLLILLLSISLHSSLEFCNS